MRQSAQCWGGKRPPGGNSRKSLFGSLQASLRDYKVPSRVLFDVATDLYESLGTPISLKCEILLRYNELEQLARASITPSDYLDPFRFADDHQAVSFLKKAPLVIEGVDPEDAAKKKFLEAEESCRSANSRIRSFVSAPLGVSGAISSVISTAIAKIHECLGSSVDASQWLASCRFGPGVFQHREVKGLTSLYDKLQVQPSVSPDAVEVAALLVTSRPQWARSITDSEVEGFWPIIKASDFDIVPGNRVAFVPKTAVTHRTIAIEPLMNIYAQLGLGTLMRRKLCRRGIDLDDQTPNQRAAREGSITGSLATLDLSSASDTVAKELVRLLLPEGWFMWLDMCRSKVGILDGKWLRYEKFSSMGNGYTFELETLIFWGLMVGVCRHLKISDESVLVYGDDIVVPVAAYDLAVEVLEWCGFSPNRAKSFHTGLFRESCGKDYFDGTEVRPFFQKEIPTRPEGLFALCNGLRQVAHRRNRGFGCDVRLYAPWRRTLQAIPRLVVQNLRVPRHAGVTDGIMFNWDESQASPFVISNKDGWEGISGLRYQVSPREGAKPGNWLGVVASQLYRLGDGGMLQRKMLGMFREDHVRWLDTLVDSVSASPRQERGATYRLRQGAFYGPWTDFGPWI
jgi:hypothetical protein